MAIKYSIDKHATALPAKVVARQGGAHIYSIELTKDHDNGSFVGKGDFLDLDLYAETDAPAFSGKIQMADKNGNFLVEVTADTEALLVYQDPVIEETYNREFMQEANFYNLKGDTVRAYSLVKGDTFWVDKLAFTGDPKVGATVSVTDGKLTVGA